MCDAMNRDIMNVLFGGMNVAPPAAKGDEAPKEHIETNIAATAVNLAEASKVCIIPGYGMAVSRAQSACVGTGTGWLIRNVLIENGVQTGFRPVSDQWQTSVKYRICAVHVTVPLLPHAQSMSPCRMSDLRSHVGCTEVSHVGFAECHFGCTSLDRIIHDSNLKVWSDVDRETGPLIGLACTVSSSGARIWPMF